VQAPEYWAKLFAQQGFYRDVDLDAGFLTPWAVCYRRAEKPIAAVVGDYERRYWHMLQESRARLQVNLQQREQLAQQEARLHQLVQELADLKRELEAETEGVRQENAALRGQMTAIEQSAGGRVLHGLQSLRASVAPPGSKRDQALTKLLRPFV
jgi:hypothetical protein